MALFDFGSFFNENFGEYQAEVKDAKEVQDHSKEFNEQMPPLVELKMKFMSLLEDWENQGSASAEGSGEPGTVAGDTYEENVWSYFLSKGYKTQAIAGIMGNMEVESGIDPTKLQGGVGPGTGLVQWEDGFSGRWNLLEKWAADEGRDKWDIQTQLDYLWIEMTSGYENSLLKSQLNRRGYDGGSGGEDTALKFGNVDNIEDAMMIFEGAIERAGIKHYGPRLKHANAFHEKYKDWTPGESSGSGASGDFGDVVQPAGPVVLTSPYGPRWGRMHKGVDFGGPSRGIHAALDGTVTVRTFDPGWGNYIKIDHGGGTETLYAHLSSFGVNKGDKVKRNQKIGVMGTTGNSTGVHLHLEVFENGSNVDPISYIPQYQNRNF